MGTARFAATVAAAAFLAGVCAAVPEVTAVAAADRSPTGSADTANTADAGGSHQGRASRPGPRGGTEGTPVSPPRAAATRNRPAPAPVAAAVPPSPKAAVTEPATPAASAAHDVPGPTRSVGPMTPMAAVAATSPAPAATPGRTAAPAARITAPQPTASAVATVSAARARPGAVAAVTSAASANAAASTAALIDKLLAPISKLFGEGTALLIRRSLFNQAPTVAPVQLTGQSEGPITGTIGAVDPEGDPLSYTITSAPLHGNAVVNASGGYTYTPAGDFTGSDNFVVAVTDTGSGFHINLLDLRRAASTSANIGVTRGALAATLRFQFIYGAGSQYWSSAARSALESAANRLASNIVLTSPVTITYDVTAEKSPLSTTLASAGSDFVPGDAGFLQTVVQNKILTGNDANGSTADGTIDWNFGPSWAYGNSVGINQYDFQSIAMHEMLHSFGFMSNIDKAGSNTGTVWTVFDGYVVNSAGKPVINNSTYSWITAFNSNLTGGSGGLLFGGPNTVAVYGGPIALYTPSPWEPGSSMSHLNAGYLMSAVADTGPGTRVLRPAELAILSDIGYTVSSGSGTPVVLFVGFVTLRVRRRRD